MVPYLGDGLERGGSEGGFLKEEWMERWHWLVIKDFLSEEAVLNLECHGIEFCFVEIFKWQ